MQKDTGGSEVVVTPAHLAGRYSRATKAVPRSVRARQHDAHLLGAWIAVDDDNKLGTVDRLAASSNCILRSGNPYSLVLSVVDDHARHFAHQSGAEPRQLAVDIDRGRSRTRGVRRAVRFDG